MQIESRVVNNFLFIKIFYIIIALGQLVSSAEANYLDPEGILRNDDGAIVYLNQHQANKACPENTQLPSARQMAIISQSRGAKEILELAQVKNGTVPEGYYKISAINIDGSKDEFFYNHEGYQNPGGTVGTDWFWTSSIFVDDTNQAFYLGGSSGFIGQDFRRFYLSAVLCLPIKN